MTDPSVVEHGEGFGNCTELCGVSNHFFDLIFKLGVAAGGCDVGGLFAGDGPAALRHTRRAGWSAGIAGFAAGCVL